MEDLRFLTVFLTALVDSVNPCAIGVLVILITTILSLYEDRKKLIRVGLIYIAAVYVSYFLAGVGLLYFIHKLQIADKLGVFVGALIILLGLVEIKDFFWYGKGFSLKIPESKMEKIKKHIEKITIPGAIVLGFFVSAVELPCTGGPYLAITTMLAREIDFRTICYLLFYNFIFVLPLIVIIVLAYLGGSIVKISEWKQEKKALMRLFTGIFMIGLGVVLFYYSLA
ncbi:GAP family protein [Candidatus Peregrinibacteria bacterium]|nr:GAP family protein [Candidatus Peregrinibacteria bacterium]